MQEANRVTFTNETYRWVERRPRWRRRKRQRRCRRATSWAGASFPSPRSNALPL